MLRLPTITGKICPYGTDDLKKRNTLKFLVPMYLGIMIILASATFFYYTEYSDALHRRTNAEAQALIDSAVLVTSDYIANFDTLMLQDYEKKLRKVPELTYAFFLDENGEAFFRDDRDNFIDIVKEKAKVADRTLLLVKEIVKDNELLGIAELGYDLSALKERLFYAKITYTVGFAFPALTITLLFYLLHRFMRRIALAEAIATQSRNQVKEILNQIDEGILTIDTDRHVGPEYSLFLERFFRLGHDRLNGVDVSHLLLDTAQINADEKDQAENALNAILDQDALAWELNSDKLPKELNFIIDGKEKWASCNWVNVLNEEDITKKIILSFLDITDKKRLESDMKEVAEKNESFLEKVTLILDIGRNEFERFIEISKNRIEKVQDLWDQPRPDWKHILLAMEELHTLKGEARSYGLGDIASTVHRCETSLSNSNYGEEHFVEYFSDLKNQVREFEKAKERIFGQPTGARTSQTVIQIVASMVPALKNIIGKVGGCLGRIDVADEVFEWNSEQLKVVRTVLTHSLTNALDHGYIIPLKKNRLNMDEIHDVTIQVKAWRDGDFMKLGIADNGFGIDYDSIAKKAKEIGYEWKTQSELVQMLFQGEISTAGNVSETSGRGVGLSAIARIVGEAGGQLRLIDNEPRGTYLEIGLPR